MSAREFKNLWDTRWNTVNKGYWIASHGLNKCHNLNTLWLLNHKGFKHCSDKLIILKDKLKNHADFRCDPLSRSSVHLRLCGQMVVLMRGLVLQPELSRAALFAGYHVIPAPMCSATVTCLFYWRPKKWGIQSWIWISKLWAN